MSDLPKYPRTGLAVTLAAGIALAVLLSVQCLRSYFYVGRVLVPQQAEREAERQGGLLAAATRTAGATDPHALGPVLARVVEESSGHIIWMRIVDPDGSILSQAGTTQDKVSIPARWWENFEKHQNTGHLVDTAQGKALVTLLPFRMPRPPRGAGGETHPMDHRPAPLILEAAVPLDSISGAFSGLRDNLFSGMLASLALLAAVAVIGFRAPHYLRGKYLEKEFELARHVQNHLLPKPAAVSPHVEFAAAAIAADHVGGDFHDIFETDSGKLAVVLGDVSGKGVSAALLVGVIQGALRSSSASHHETSCERINRMLCEKTAAERFATMFWGIFDPLTSTLRYVNAGHSAPLLLRASAPGGEPERLDQGGPVLGMLPGARYCAGVIQLEPGDTLILYSDGVNEAANSKHEEFGDDRILRIVSTSSVRRPEEICEQVMAQVAGFITPGSAQDDRTLMVVRFLSTRAAMTA